MRCSGIEANEAGQYPVIGGDLRLLGIGGDLRLLGIEGLDFWASEATSDFWATYSAERDLRLRGHGDQAQGSLLAELLQPMLFLFGLSLVHPLLDWLDETNALA